MSATTGTRTVTSAARRAQIVAATLEVIARDGAAQASFARIAEHAGLSSTRLISYHFADRAELLTACVEDVVAAVGQAVGRAVEAQPDGPSRLRAYIESVVAFSDVDRVRMQALLQIVLAGGWAAGADGSPATGPLEAMLAQGQAEGAFRDFDVRVMASTVQRAVEALPFQLAADPGLDCAAWAQELVVLFDLATAAPR